jgi:class 3 adenylate cyclase
VDFRLLGPLEVIEDEREVSLPGGKPRGLLGLLLLEPGRPVPVGQIIDGLWGDRPPPTAPKVVQAYVSRLRKALGDGCLETAASGYLLRVQAGSLDAQRFEDLVGRGRSLVAAGESEQGARVLEEALGLWRGPALVDFRDEAFAQNEIRRLEDLRLVAMELRLQVELALGRSAEAVGELEVLVRSHPLRESLRGLLMLALYRSGRQADALAVYQDTRTALVEELGLEPSRSLQQLEQAILRHDESLDLKPVAVTLVPVGPVEVGEEGKEPAQQGAARKVVTILFCDVTGSTALGDELDPETLRLVLARYFERASAVIERHGGSVEKFIGDAVMAVFGIPVLHEDDALRAVRAASSLLAELPGLNDELMREVGTRLELRIGISTGEVVTGTRERLATGDAITVAARLEQAANPGEVLIGPETLALAREGIVVEPAGELTLGKSRPVSAFRLVSVSPDSPRASRHLDVPIVGRVEERKRLEDAFGDAVGQPACRLVTLLGPAGVGKSRLAAEFLAGLDARVVSGRCLSYGEGITYWPVTEVVGQLEAAREQLLVDHPATGPVFDALFGEGSAATPGEIAWATRKVLETAAADRSLVVVFDDIHWGEPTFLDLIEHATELSAGSPILILCLARPELLDHRPSWANGPSETVRVEPLGPVETSELILRLTGTDGFDSGLAERIGVASGGNPLFVEEMVAMARDADQDALVVPATIKALLAARIDQLDPDERGVLERGSVEGQLFHRGAVEALAARPEPVLGQLVALVRKELVRPDRPQLPTEDAYRFRHILIRDAAYDALPKAARATLHERFGNWLVEHGGELAERDEIVGYHLELSHGYRIQLGQPDAATDELAARAAAHLTAAGRRATDRSDKFAAIAFFARAIELDSGARPRLVCRLAELQYQVGEYARAVELLDEAVEAARARGDVAVEMVAAVQRGVVVNQRGDPDTPFEAVIRIADHATEILDTVGDDEQLAHVLYYAAAYRGFAGGGDDAVRLHERAFEHALRAGDLHRARVALEGVIGSKAWGSTPVSEFFAFLESRPEETKRLLAASNVPHHHSALMAAYAGDFVRAHEEYAIAGQILAEFANPVVAASLPMILGLIELLGGNPEEAERVLRDCCDRLGDLGAQGLRATAATLLAEAFLRQGRDVEAADTLDLADEIAQPDDYDARVRSHLTRARLLARRGDIDEAERLADQALEAVSRGNNIVLRGTVLLALAEVSQASGRIDDSEGALREALELFGQKEDVVQAEQARQLLSALRSPT